jgi:membrane complex biogenesis BtpA family protein
MAYTLSDMGHPRPTSRGTDFLSPGNILIGMVHVGATPGTPRAEYTVSELVNRAISEATKLKNAGFDAAIVENMHDAPYVHGSDLGPEQTTAMTLAASAVREIFPGPLGVQILSGGNQQAMAVSHAVGAGFIRCENFVFSHVADEGLLAKAEAGQLLRYRKHIGADDVAVFADIKKKHASHAITGDVSIEDAIEAAQFFGVDAIIITGSSTGKAADISDLKSARKAASVPVLVGSGVTPDSVPALLEHADALIVGSSIKEDGNWYNNIDPARADAIVSARESVR